MREYLGELSDDQEHGIGCYLDEYANNPMKYLGEFDHDKVEGVGIKYWSQKNTKREFTHTYVGEWKDNQRVGVGMYEWDNGALWVGEFKDNVACGYGIFTTQDGLHYVGTMLGEKLNRWPDNKERLSGDGKWYDSEWTPIDVTTWGYDQRGEITVDGINYWPIGRMFSKDTYISAYGESYHGDMVNGQRHGRGIYKGDNGYIYDGEWKYKKKNG